jgi:hypothetical protein
LRGLQSLIQDLLNAMILASQEKRADKIIIANRWPRAAFAPQRRTDQFVNFELILHYAMLLTS